MSEINGNKVHESTGKLILAGFEGYEITADCQAVKLIKKHKVRSFILGSKNFVNVPQISKLIDDLQVLAKLEGYEHPLLIAVDQELGCCNAMFDEVSLTQFPGAMGLAATDDLELIYKVGEAVAIELRSIGFNYLTGPALDICSKMSNQLIGVRSFGSTVEDVTKYATAFTRGLKKGGILTQAKHFPGIGSSFVDNLLELPMMLETSSQLECFNVLPFKNLIDEGLIDSVHAGGVAVPNISPNEIHACLSPIIVQKLLRKNLRFDGLVISECLELEALCRNIGLGQGAVLSILYARCDMVMVCNDYIYQEEALSSLSKAYESGNYDPIFAQSIRRIDELHRKLKWSEKIQLNKQIWIEHQKLSIKAYSSSVTLVRDQDDAIPINKYFKKNDENNVLILTPLITQIHPDVHNLNNDEAHNNAAKLFPGEDVFHDFGEKLASYDESQNYKVLHTSYTANGLSSLHESLIENSKVVILVCADASRNMYQIGIAKHISVLCGGYKKLSNFTKKPLIIISVSSPYDFLYHNGIGSTYICTYDYTSNVLSHIPSVLFGNLKPGGKIPGENQKYDYKEDLFDMSPSTVSTGSPMSKSIEFLLNDTNLRSPPPPALQQQQQQHQQNNAKRLMSNESPFVSGAASPIGSTTDIHKRKRKKLNKPWLVEKFDYQRDYTNLVLLLKNSLPTQDFCPISSKFTSKLHQLFRDTSKEQEHFVVRNSTLNVIYGICITWINEQTEEGHILFMLVDKTKRRQSIGQMIHERAIKYLRQEKKCKLIHIGGTFPLLGFFKENRLDELIEFWKFMDNTKSSDTSMLKQDDSMYGIIEFAKSVGWADTKSFVKQYKKVRKYTLSLDLNNWKVSEKLVKQLKIVGVKFELLNDHEEILNLLKVNKFTDDEEIRFLEIYEKSSKFINEEKKKSSNNNNIMILKAYEPASKSILGSVILFNNNSALSCYYPFVDAVSEQSPPSNAAASSKAAGILPSAGGISSSSNEIIYGLCGLFVDSNYESLKSVLKLGLICSGVSFVKKLNGSKLVVSDFTDIQELTESGFEIFGEYCTSYADKKSYEF